MEPLVIASKANGRKTVRAHDFAAG